METASSNRKLAFPRWHERQLFHAYAWFTTCLLGGVVIAVLLEFVGLDTPGITPLITLVALYVAGLMTITRKVPAAVDLLTRREAVVLAAVRADGFDIEVLDRVMADSTEIH